MKIELTKNQQKLKDELKEYLSALLNKELLSEMSDPQFFEGGGPEFKKALKIMGQDGWIGLSWPKEFGGKEFTPIEQYIFVEEIMRTGFPFPFLTTESVGPMIAQYGSDWAKETIAKSILRGETIFEAGVPESFNVLVKEMQSLCLDVSLSNDNSTQKIKNNSQENS